MTSPSPAPTAADTAEVACQELLRAVRELGGHREGSYTLSARLNPDGSYCWAWHWFPPTSRDGGSAGSSLP